MESRRCYIAKYPLNSMGDDLNEIIIAKDTYFSPRMRELWRSLVSQRKPQDTMLQCWYSDQNGAECLCSTNQPFRLS